MEDAEDMKEFSLVSDQDKNITARELRDRLRSMRACYHMMKQHGNTLAYSITNFDPDMHDDEEQFRNYLQNLSDRATLFGISSRAMIKVCTDYLESSETDSHRVFKMLQFERERTRELEKMLYDTAKQHTTLEYKTRRMSIHLKRSSTGSKTQSLNDEDENEPEAEPEPETEPDIELSEVDSLEMIRRSVWMSRQSKWQTQRRDESVAAPPPPPTPVRTSMRRNSKKRRKRIPDRPNISVNAWSILKNSIGKDLSKIPMPVNFNEPLSLLQRITEEMEYAELLDTAAIIEDKYEQIAYVAAFSISAYAASSNRTAKPFNPLLYETYECDRTDDLGWRAIAEQVSHYPPIAAMYCEGSEWICWQEASVKIKFKGKNLQIVPSGNVYCKFLKTGNTYCWNKATTIVNNIIVGKMWLDQQGEVKIKGLNSAADASCTLTYVPFSMFSRETQRRVKGEVKNQANETKFIIQGYWDSHVEIVSTNAHVKKKTADPDRGSFNTIWKRRMPDPGSEKYHNFSRFTCQLNELEEGVAPTDSRLRPDLRLMEQGRWDESNVEKLRIEEKQRLKFRNSDAEKETRISVADFIEPHDPIWFARSFENGQVVHNYNGAYWEAKHKQDWSRCPDIF